MTVLQNSRASTAKVVAVSPATKVGGYGQNLTALWWAAQKIRSSLPHEIPPPAYYIVQWGDDLYDIARRFEVPGGWPALYEFNKAVIGRNPNLIFPGQVLHFPNYQPVVAKPPTKPPPPPPRPKPPPPKPRVPTVYKPPPRKPKRPVQYREHLVIEGDRLETLAYRQYGAAIFWWVIAEANPELMHPEDDLVPGIVIRIPRKATDAFATASSQVYAPGLGGL